jgi:hypothetical protein
MGTRLRAREAGQKEIHEEKKEKRKVKKKKPSNDKARC